jgi:hypothetical protein
MCVFDAAVSSKGEYFEMVDTIGTTRAWYQCNNGVWGASTAGRRWTVKNLFELKSAQRVLLEGNIFENNWADAQNGYGLLLQGLISDSGSWATVNDVVFTKNIIRRTAGAINLCGSCGDPPTPRLNRVSFVNNVFEDVNRYLGSGFDFNGTLLQIVGKAQDVSFSHNTAFPSFKMLSLEGGGVAGLYFVDNISNHGTAVIGCGPAGGLDALGNCVTGWTMTNNVMVAPPSSVNNQIPYPSGNFYPASYDEVGFVNANNGLDGNYLLKPSSPYKGKGTDGKDIGADINAVMIATRGV